MKVVTVVGARPQFIKAAPVSRVLRQRHEEVLVDTGQHYDPALSRDLRDELGGAEPSYSLGVGSAPHGAQTGRMLEAVEGVLVAERPDAVLVYGDTNSTLAGALAAAKCGLPIVHVEAGLRSFDRAMPEEVNRVLTDHLATLLCCPSDTAARHLAAEGITRGVEVVGDVMLDALLATRNAIATLRDTLVPETGGRPFTLFTLHRPSNTDDPARLRRILAALARVEGPVLWPVHPRVRAALATLAADRPAHVHLLPPLGYRALVATLDAARAVVTDSGGLQKEAYWLGVPCVTLRDTTEWTETVASGWNRLLDVTTADLGACLATLVRPDAPRDAYGAPGAAARIVSAIERALTASSRPGVTPAASAAPAEAARAA